MFMSHAFRVIPVDGESVDSASIVELRETKLWSDHIPDKSELKGYWAPFDWNQMPEPSWFSRYMADVQGYKLDTVHKD